MDLNVALRGIFSADSFLLTGARAKNIQMIKLELTQRADVQALDDNGVGAAEWALRASGAK